MTKIYMIRHAEAEGNLYRLSHGQYNSTITPRGYRQLAALRARFRDVRIDAVYGSDLLRAQTTASALYVPRGLPFRPMPQFREVLVGDWEGKTWAELYRDDAEALYNFNFRPGLWRVRGAETYDAVQARMLAGVRQIAAAHPDGAVAATSHAAALRMLMGGIRGLTMDEIGQEPYCENTGVTLLEVEGDEIRIIFQDDTSHLTGDLAIDDRKGDAHIGRWKKVEMFFQHREEDGRLLCDGFVPEGQADFAGAAARLAMVREPEALRITEYWVDPRLRQRRVGNQLMGQVVPPAREMGYDTVVITCPAETEGFFGHFGFVTTAREGEMCHMAMDIRRIIRDIPEL